MDNFGQLIHDQAITLFSMFKRSYSVITSALSVIPAGNTPIVFGSILLGSARQARGGRLRATISGEEGPTAGRRS